MGREVRRVPKDWQHPTTARGLQPLRDGYRAALAEFEAYAKEKGLEDALDYFGRAPRKDDYMPDWPAAERTHFMMYEDTTEGTPISPAFATPEELAKWLADNGASSFGSFTATYEQWLSMIKAGWAPSAVMDSAGLRSGVEASTTTP